MIPFENIGQRASRIIGEHWGVCYDYALEHYGAKSQEYGEDCWEVFSFILENFEQIPLAQVCKGDLIVYHEHRPEKPVQEWEKEEFIPEYGNVEHFGIVERTSKSLPKIRVKSQWGCTKTYEHTVGAVPIIYGTHVSFWKLKPTSKLNKKRAVKSEEVLTFA